MQVFLQNFCSISLKILLQEGKKPTLFIFMVFGRYLEYKIITIIAIYSKKIVTHQM